MGTHDFDGEKYTQASKHQKEWGNAIISELKFTGNESVLDLGCGDGVLTGQIADMLPRGRVVGIDASEGMIATAAKLESVNLAFIKMDIDDISYNNVFNLIFSNAALHWVKDHKKLLRNCQKALKPGGSLRFNFAGDGNCSNFFAVIKVVMKDEKYKEYFRNFEWPWYMPPVDEYKETVSCSGFKDIKVWGENADRYFSGRDEMIKWIEQPSIVPLIKMVAAKDKDEFMRDVVDQMIARTEGDDGRCFETFRRINVYAVKQQP